MLALAFGAPAQVLETKTYATTGRPVEAYATADGQYVLVTVAGHGGIDVFRKSDGGLQRVAFQSLSGNMPQGILLIPHTQILAVGVSNAGVAFLPLAATLEGKAEPKALPQGEGSGSGYLAVAPDGQTLFVANEYGMGGNIGVIALHRDEEGHIHPQAIANIPSLRATPGVTISPDGARVYSVGEVLPPQVTGMWPGHGVKELERSGCTQQIGGRSMPNGALYVIDAKKAAALPAGTMGREAQSAKIAWLDAGCSPVREQVSADGSLLYMTARGDNRVLVFDTKKLEHDPQHALVRAIDSGGDAPVGLLLFDNDTKLLVANSNRFAGGKGNAAVIDVSQPGKAPVVQKIKTGEFPRNITASPDGGTLYLTIFNGDELMVLTPKK